MSTRLRYLLVVAGLCLYVAAGVAALWAGLTSDLAPGDRSVMSRVLREQVAFAIVIAILFLLGLALLVWLLFRAYVLPLRRLADETTIITTANPGHRLPARGAGELRRLGAAINELAERSQAAQRDLDDKIAAARGDLEQERNRLAALMAELTLAVLVCNVDGRILLYNEAARQLLGDGTGTAGPVGLGRSVFGIVDRSLIAHALEQIRLRPPDDGPAAPVQLTATGPGGRLLRAAMAPVGGPEAEMTGFVLTLEDVTRAATAGSRRDALLQSLTEGTRASVGTIRAAIESMLDYPEMEAAERERFLAIIHDEVVALGARVEDTLRESADYLRDQWSLAEVLGRDLLAAVQRSLESEVGVTATAEDAHDEVWLRVDSYAVVQAIAYLASRLQADAGISSFSLDLREAGRYARLDLGWDGARLDQETLRAWAQQPLSRDGAGLTSTLSDVVELHGGEVWSEADTAVGTACVRLLLPIAESGPQTAPARPRRPVEAAALTREEFYDFDLFRTTEGGPDWDERDLSELAYTVFDTETTGLSPSEDEIIAIGAVRIVNGRLLRQETIDQLVDPGRPVPAAAVRVHGISSEMVRGQPTIDEVLPAFAAFTEDTVLVGHNVGFDMRFLELKAAQTGARFTQPVLDTLLLSAVVHPEHDDHSLEAMAARLGISVVGRHTALGDAIVTGEVFLRQIRLLQAQGLGTLGAARDAARRTYHARLSESLYSKA